MMGSAVWGGKLPLEQALKHEDVDGISVGSELQRHGWAGERRAAPRPYTAAFELHIEQGPILETDGVEIGVVTGVQGFRWYTLELFGHPAHAGPTPMELRRDPARALHEILAAAYAAAAGDAPHARTTIAQFRSEPISPNTVPERVACSFDIRHPDAATLDGLEASFREAVETAAERHGVRSAITVDADSAPVAFHPDCIGAVERSADAIGLSHQRIISGAGHDACYVALHVPTSMIFVPCDDGLSHNEAENISAQQAEQGASVLLGAVRAMAG